MEDEGNPGLGLVTARGWEPFRRSGTEIPRSSTVALLFRFFCSIVQSVLSSTAGLTTHF